MAKRNISGILPLCKPYGISSNKALQKTKYLFAAAKSGHAGTLDPMATGVLPVCMGEATKFSSVLLHASKTYEAVLKLGYQSTTGDIEGDIERLPGIDTQALTVQNCEKVLAQFVGHTVQLPPMYSALKHQGKPLYFYARKGESIERPSRVIFIHKIKIKALKEDTLTISVKCGTGTYIRTLAEDIGKALGCGSAYLVNLCRSSVGCLDLPRAIKLTDLEAMNEQQRDRCLLPIDSFMHDFPMVVLDNRQAQQILQGQALSRRSFNKENYQNQINDEEASVRLYYQQQFLGLGTILADHTLKPKRLLSDAYLGNQNKLLFK